MQLSDRYRTKQSTAERYRAQNGMGITAGPVPKEHVRRQMTCLFQMQSSNRLSSDGSQPIAIVLKQLGCWPAVKCDATIRNFSISEPGELGTESHAWQEREDIRP